MRNLVHFGWKMVCNAVHNAFLNSGDGVLMRSCRFLTMGLTAFLHVLLEMTSAALPRHDLHRLLLTVSGSPIKIVN